MNSSFQKFFIERPSTFFAQLEQSAKFESVYEGRAAAVLLDCKTRGGVPIVRTTTVYDRPAQPFRKIHDAIVEDVKSASKVDNLHFNNALFERYTSSYTKMGFHSDQALDLKEDTHIAVYSCYNSENPMTVRTLVVKNKETGENTAITMEHNSVILFSLATNQKHLHKIVVIGGARGDARDDVWLGLTMRCSKTFVEFSNNVPLINGRELILADETQRREFCRLRSQENKHIEHRYPQIDFTISKSDLLPPSED